MLYRFRTRQNYPSNDGTGRWNAHYLPGTPISQLGKVRFDVELALERLGVGSTLKD